MSFNDRQRIYREIEADRNTKVIAFVTSDRRGLETQIAQDCIDCFVDLLDKIGPTKSLTCVLHTGGGQTLAAWRLINLLRMFADKLEIVIPQKALSAGTLMSIGADKLVMTKQAALGPIDPSVNSPLNPVAVLGGQSRPVPVSVENIRGYLDAIRDDLGIRGKQQLAVLIDKLSEKVHPLVLGEIFRSRAQIRFLAGKLLTRQVRDKAKTERIIDFLCADSGSHDYTINRREALGLGLKVEKPTDRFYRQIREIQLDYFAEMKLLEPYQPESLLAGVPAGTGVAYSHVRGLVESTEGGCYGYMSDGTLELITVPTPAGMQSGIKDQRTFEGWRKIV